MPTILLTGANRGLGLQFAGQYAADGWRVIATCRDPANAADLKAVAGQVEVHVLDVTDFKAIEALAVELIGTPIDILLNNAGIIGPDNHNFGDIDYDGWADTFRVNAMAPMKMVECFIDHVAASERKMIVSISSKLASMVENTDGGHYIYRSSKAALNAVHMSLANDLADRGIASVVFHPDGRVLVWVDLGPPLILAKVLRPFDLLSITLGSKTVAVSSTMMDSLLIGSFDVP